jgi:hypothetical protein
LYGVFVWARGALNGPFRRCPARSVSLWIESAHARAGHCKAFDTHAHGNDGLWVIEYDEEALMRAELARMAELGVPVMLGFGRAVVSDTEAKQAPNMPANMV